MDSDPDETSFVSVFSGDVTLEPVRDEIVDDSIAVSPPEQPIMTNPYDTDNKDETVENITLKAATIKTQWTPDDLAFFFTNLETDMEFIGVKSQYLKRQCLKKNLPESVVTEFKG